MPAWTHVMYGGLPLRPRVSEHSGVSRSHRLIEGADRVCLSP
jgi:hypothetical protein